MPTPSKSPKPKKPKPSKAAREARWFRKTLQPSKRVQAELKAAAARRQAAKLVKPVRKPAPAQAAVAAIDAEAQKLLDQATDRQLQQIVKLQSQAESEVAMAASRELARRKELADRIKAMAPVETPAEARPHE